MITDLTDTERVRILMESHGLSKRLDRESYRILHEDIEEALAAAFNRGHSLASKERANG